ncbi:DUF5642 family protein [Nocardia stercoris]|uniref:Sensor domain-containing protein n=1 Tax=Nocardia stercoris TaxID=2483361 RepID=A0A3M2KYK0_9NOCA|nr:DUF5642 family protein [Nocardia stercoris]RMI30174.1 sensor domain-containing protein [Nocardia stercoris]
MLGYAVLGSLLAACGSTVSGHPGPATTGGPQRLDRHIAAPLSTLLPGPEQFPNGYAVLTLPPDRARQAGTDLAGIPAGSATDPADCAPPVPPPGTDDPAAEVGSDDTTRTSITVELTRDTEPLATLRDQLERCTVVRTLGGSITKTVTTELLPPPPADADDTLALHRTVAGAVGGPGLTQSTTALIAQIDDVRITVASLIFGDAPADTTALDQVFTAAVDRVRAG